MVRPVRDAQARDEGPKEANVSRLPTCQTRRLAGWPVYGSEWRTARQREFKRQQCKSEEWKLSGKNGASSGGRTTGSAASGCNDGKIKIASGGILVRTKPARCVGIRSKTMESKPSLAILVPVYNEQYLVETSLKRLGVLADCPVLSRVQVIVVNDASKDQSAAALKRFQESLGDRNWRNSNGFSWSARGSRERARRSGRRYRT